MLFPKVAATQARGVSRSLRRTPRRENRRLALQKGGAFRRV